AKPHRPRRPPRSRLRRHHRKAPGPRRRHRAPPLPHLLSRTAKIRELCYNPAVLLGGLVRVDAPSPYTDTGGTIMRNTELLNKIDAAIAEKNLLKHPFYQDWQAGKLSREALQLYSAQYYRHVEAFPKHLRVLAARTEGPLRDTVMENLAEEENPAAPHPKLWRDFAAAV